MNQKTWLIANNVCHVDYASIDNAVAFNGDAHPWLAHLNQTSLLFDLLDSLVILNVPHFHLIFQVNTTHG